jgi:putative membrane protein
MAAEWIVAYLHFISVLALAGLLVAELLLYRPALNAASAALLQRVDLAFGITAGVVLATGLLRVFWVGKGAAYYLGNPFFHALWIGFLVVASISIAPTLHFLRWGKGPRQGQAPVIPEPSFKLVRRALLIEVHLFAILPLLAVLMARGIGR